MTNDEGTRSEQPERVLFVHAHPDDETIDTGGTIALLVARGAEVTVLTCTRGERGEVIPDDLKPALESAESMAALRTRELEVAMRCLGVTDHRYLGDDHARYLDSGMRWGRHGAEPAGDSDPASLVAADFDDVVADVASVVADVAPSAVVSYTDRGGYGHPDHIRAYQAARHAAELYDVPFYSVLPVASMSAVGSIPAAGARLIEVDVEPVLDRKRGALEAYRSQLTLDEDTIVFSGGQRQPISLVERYVPIEPLSEQPVPFAEQHPAARFAVAVLAGVIGAIFGALLSVYSQSPWWIAGIVVIAALLTGLRLAFDSRIVVGFAAVPMIVIVGLLSIQSAGGSVLVLWTGQGIVWQLAPTIVGLVVILVPGKLRSAQSKGPQQP